MNRYFFKVYSNNVIQGGIMLYATDYEQACDFFRFLFPDTAFECEND